MAYPHNMSPFSPLGRRLRTTDADHEGPGETGGGMAAKKATQRSQSVIKLKGKPLVCRVAASRCALELDC